MFDGRSITAQIASADIPESPESKRLAAARAMDEGYQGVAFALGASVEALIRERDNLREEIHRLQMLAESFKSPDRF